MFDSVYLRPCCFWLGGKKVPMMERRERTVGMLLDESLASVGNLGIRPSWGMWCQALGVCLPARESCRVVMAGTTLHVGN